MPLNKTCIIEIILEPLFEDIICPIFNANFSSTCKDLLWTYYTLIDDRLGKTDIFMKVVELLLLHSDIDLNRKNNQLVQSNLNTIHCV